MDNETKPMSTKELTQAVNLLLERETERDRRTRRRRRRRVKQKRDEMRESVEHLQRSVETIKWCIIGITTVMALALLILIVVVFQVRSEAERIKVEVVEIRDRAQEIVDDIEKEAESIREKIQNPIRTIGGAIGGRLDDQVRGLIGDE